MGRTVLVLVLLPAFGSAFSASGAWLVSLSWAMLSTTLSTVSPAVDLISATEGAIVGVGGELSLGGIDDTFVFRCTVRIYSRRRPGRLPEASSNMSERRRDRVTVESMGALAGHIPVGVIQITLYICAMTRVKFKWLKAGVTEG